MAYETLKPAYPDIGSCTCANLRRATRMVTQTYDAALRPAGLRATQFTMLAVLAKHGQTRQGDLADILGMDGTTLTRNLQPLLQKGWIVIERAQDQRVRLICLTGDGRAKADQALPLWHAVQDRFVNGPEGAQLAGLLNGIKQADPALRQR